MAVLLCAGFPFTPATSSATNATDGAGGAAAARTWVVDAVDDAFGSRWVSRDTGRSEMTVRVGDTVEWRFEFPTAGQGHDLTSQDTSAVWNPPIQEYRVPDDPRGPVIHTFDEPGVFHYLCTIHGATMSGTVVVEEVAPPNQAPTAGPVVEPRQGPAPLQVHFTANGSDPDEDPLAYRWDFGTRDDASDVSTSAHAAHEYTTPGTYTATLDVHDGRGGRHTETFPITVTRREPDDAPPQTAILVGPSGAVAASGATFELWSSEPGSSFHCSLDGQAWRNCAPRFTLDGLQEGRHRLLVRAIDPAGNTDATPTSRFWTVDRTGPVVRDLRPLSVVSDRTPTVRAAVFDRLSSVRGGAIVLHVDGHRVRPVDHAPRSGTVKWTPRRALRVGRHAVRITVPDVAGNRTVRTWRFAIRR